MEEPKLILQGLISTQVINIYANLYLMEVIPLKQLAPTFLKLCYYV